MFAFMQMSSDAMSWPESANRQFFDGFGLLLQYINVSGILDHRTPYKHKKCSTFLTIYMRYKNILAPHKYLPRTEAKTILAGLSFYNS